MKHQDEVSVIDMTVLNDDGFLSPYSPTDKPIINTEVAEFLENSANAHTLKSNFVIRIHSNCIDEEEKVQYKDAIKNYYGLKLSSSGTDLRRNLIVSVIFTLVGVLGLVLMFLLDHFNVSGIWVEVADIFAWVFVWEAVYMFFIERNKTLRERRKFRAIHDSEVEYCSLVK
ncbi:MAG: hypothetical protein NC132_01010 [Corallococcus sp.]|nr:hypothetical protein [Corallococcus sp.]MCM1359501.1 hypothetical protein [Corallococcus sp.]MCM1394687.1 hypothetical protein [Corallococcus sp.]